MIAKTDRSWFQSTRKKNSINCDVPTVLIAQSIQ